MYQPSQLLTFLQANNRQPNKKLSQNFLIDRHVLDRIIAGAQIKAGDHVLEIGSGAGALTESLIRAQAEVIAVEIDPVLAKTLAQRGEASQWNLTVVENDFLKVSLPILLAQFPQKKGWKVVANLPYHITSPILERLLEHESLFESITIMVQKECAQRMIARCNDNHYGSMSLFMRYYLPDLRVLFQVAPHSFYPPPSVESTVLHSRVAVELPELKEAFFLLTRSSFGQRRKMIRQSLKRVCSATELDAVCKAVGSTVRPENLSYEQFLAMARLIS